MYDTVILILYIISNLYICEAVVYIFWHVFTHTKYMYDTVILILYIISNLYICEAVVYIFWHVFTHTKYMYDTVILILYIISNLCEALCHVVKAIYSGMYSILFILILKWLSLYGYCCHMQVVRLV